jgi:DNA-binding NtrC family response regulator
VRELKHAIAQAAIFATGDELGPDDFSTLSARSEMLPAAGGAPRTSERGAVESVTPEELAEAFRTTGGNKLEAAKVLGISRSSLYRILRKMPAGEPASTAP